MMKAIVSVALLTATLFGLGRSLPSAPLSEFAEMCAAPPAANAAPKALVETETPGAGLACGVTAPTTAR